jgi:transcription elongation GreA/GreB family factor
MSRAFVKENDGSDFSESLPDRPVSDTPNYVTARGLRLIDEEIARLRQALAEAQAAQERGHIARHSRDLRYWASRRGTAQVIAPSRDPEVAAFGSLVTLEHEDERRQRIRIVGEDEADPAQGRVSWCAPIAQMLAGNRVGDTVGLPSGEVEIVGVDQAPEA